MYNPFSDYINQLQRKPAVTNQPNRSRDHTFMLNMIIRNVPTL